MERRRKEAGKSQKGGHLSLPILPGYVDAAFSFWHLNVVVDAAFSFWKRSVDIGFKKSMKF